MPEIRRNHSGDLKAFIANVSIVPAGCHPWTGGKASNGYGIFWVGSKSKSVLAHRFALEQALGHDLLEEECALHRCDNRACQNPDHLFVGSKQENSDDMIAKGRAFNGSSRRPITESEVLQMIEMRAADKSWYAIGLKFGRHQQVVKRKVDKYLAAKYSAEVAA